MKKERIFSSVIAILSFSLFFMPTAITGIEGSRWMSISQEVFATLKMHFFNNPIYVFQIFICIIGIITIVTSVINIVKNKPVFQLIATITSCIYVVVWLVMLFVSTPHHLTVYEWFTNGRDTDVIWLILYLAILITILVLSVLPYILSLPRRPSKTARLEARVDELEKQVDELKSDEK